MNFFNLFFVVLAMTQIARDELQNLMLITKAHAAARVYVPTTTRIKDGYDQVEINHLHTNFEEVRYEVLHSNFVLDNDNFGDARLSR